jgi:hypothetical protein
LDHPNIVPFHGYAADQEIFRGLGALISPVVWDFIRCFYLTMLQWYDNGDAGQFLKLHGENMDKLARSTMVRIFVSSTYQH